MHSFGFRIQAPYTSLKRDKNSNQATKQQKNLQNSIPTKEQFEVIQTFKCYICKTLPPPITRRRHQTSDTDQIFEFSSEKLADQIFQCKTQTKLQSKREICEIQNQQKEQYKVLQIFKCYFYKKNKIKKN